MQGSHTLSPHTSSDAILDRGLLSWHTPHWAVLSLLFVMLSIVQRTGSSVKDYSQFISAKYRAIFTRQPSTHRKPTQATITSTAKAAIAQLLFICFMFTLYPMVYHIASTKHNLFTVVTPYPHTTYEPPIQKPTGRFRGMGPLFPKFLPYIRQNKFRAYLNLFKTCFQKINTISKLAQNLV